MERLEMVTDYICRYHFDVTENGFRLARFEITQQTAPISAEL
jgi:hypothetical protein